MDVVYHLTQDKKVLEGNVSERNKIKEDDVLLFILKMNCSNDFRQKIQFSSIAFAVD